MTDTGTEAGRALSMLDLTSLGDDDSPASVGTMLKRAVTPAGPVAAVCVWPAFVAQAKSALAGTTVRVATVSNFPHGRPDIAGAVATTKQVVADGADEVDVVWPYDSWLNGNSTIAGDLVAACKDACGSTAHLKVILETGRLQTATAIAGSSRDAIAAGADFIKTSTGKESVNATLPVSLVMIRAIRDYEAATGIRIGYKPAGGISKAKDALVYLSLIKEELGDRWLEPDLFRFGASSLLGDIERQLEHHVTGAYSASHRHAAG